MKITIYELLGLIKEGKAPEKIKYQDYCWGWTGDDYETRKLGVQKFLITGQEYTWVTDFLKDKVEIIEEEKEIEKINLNDNGTLGFPNGCWTARNMDKAFTIKINELIDEINKLKANL